MNAFTLRVIGRELLLWMAFAGVVLALQQSGHDVAARWVLGSVGLLAALCLAAAAALPKPKFPGVPFRVDDLGLVPIENGSTIAFRDRVDVGPAIDVLREVLVRIEELATICGADQNEPTRDTVEAIERRIAAALQLLGDIPAPTAQEIES